MSRGNISEVLRRHLQELLADISRQIASSTPDRCELRLLTLRCDQLCTHMNRLAGIGGNSDINDAVACVSQAVGYLEQAVQENSQPYQTPTVESAGRGRPRYDVKSEQLEFLIHHGFSASIIATMLGAQFEGE